MDVFFIYEKFLFYVWYLKWILWQEKLIFVLIFYWGIKKQFFELDLYNIFFSDDYRIEFNYLVNGKVYEDFIIYINIIQKYCLEDVLEGMENWFVMVNVFYDLGQDWE